MPNPIIAATRPPHENILCGGEQGGKLSGVYAPMARTHDVKRGNGASGEVKPRLRWSLAKELVATFLRLRVSLAERKRIRSPSSQHWGV